MAIRNGQLPHCLIAKDPKLFAAMAEAPLEDLQRLRNELSGLIQDLSATA